MPLYFEDRSQFASGAASYNYAPISSGENSNRIIIQVMINGQMTQAFVDTGGVFIVISPEIADSLSLDPDQGLSTPALYWRGRSVAGMLHQVSLELMAETGYSLIIEGTAFVPSLSPFQEWPDEFPCILGMQGCFERLRFAVDPANDTFYFGELSG